MTAGVDHAVQIALRARLLATPGVIALVPPRHILDRHRRPVLLPGIVLGDSQVVDTGASVGRDRWEVFHHLHVWRKEASLEGVKIAAGVIAAALRDRLDLGPGYHCADCRVQSVRFLREATDELSHAVLTVVVIVQELGL